MVKLHWNDHFAHLKRTRPYTESIDGLKRDKTELDQYYGRLIRRETQKPFYTAGRTINTTMHGGYLYILLHPLEYSVILFYKNVSQPNPFKLY